MAIVSRRRFVQGVAGSTLLAATTHTPLYAQPAPTVLAGTAFDLSIDTLPVNYTGAWRQATAVNGQVPAPLLRWREGDTVTLRVTNRLPVTTSLHWHGMIVPADMDGVPGLSFPGIAPGQSYSYRLRVKQSGTYWYHSHSGFQEQSGLYGPIVIEPRAGQRYPAARDYVVLLSDWTDSDPEHIYATLKRQSNYYNFGRRTAGDFVAATRVHGLKAALSDWSAWGRMRMDPTDLADVSGYAYTYLMNGSPPARNWTALFNPGQSVRLRFINGSSMSFFDVRIPGLDLTVVAADGQDIEPITVEEFRIGAAEVYDVIVKPKADRAYTIFAQAMDRSGYARGTLAPRAGMQVEVPALDPRAQLTMADLGMSMSGANGMAATTAPGGAAAAHMPGMANMPGMSGMSALPHAAAAGRANPTSVHHPHGESGPGVDMQVQTPWSRLDDPGVGLRHNGRRVLTYADLHTLGGPIDAREPGREIELHLTGHMQRFMWSFDGQKFSQAEPLRFNAGERLRLVLVNDTMMTHPIHLHGMWSELVAPNGGFQVRKHTVTVQPAQRLSYLVTADALGRWAYHCHLLYHMQAGMFREVIVARAHATAGAAAHS